MSLRYWRLKCSSTYLFAIVVSDVRTTKFRPKLRGREDLRSIPVILGRYRCILVDRFPRKIEVKVGESLQNRFGNKGIGMCADLCASGYRYETTISLVVSYHDVCLWNRTLVIVEPYKQEPTNQQCSSTSEANRPINTVSDRCIEFWLPYLFVIL